MLPVWAQQPFSGVRASGTTRLFHSVVFPPDLQVSGQQEVGEIYFIYKNYYGNEFLFAIAQPSEPVYYTYGTQLDYGFTFGLNNTNVQDIYTIEYTYPQDIEDHNQYDGAHEGLLARDGSRTATNTLKYESTPTLTDPLDIPNLGYIQSQINSNLPCGFMAYWPKPTAPAGWLVRDGSAISRTTYKDLFNAIGTDFGAGDGVNTFNLPDDRGYFIRGYNPSNTAVSGTFAQKQASGAPNIVGYTDPWTAHSNASIGIRSCSGAFRSAGRWTIISRGETAGGCEAGLNFNASWSNSLYGASPNEIRPQSVCYLPIIKYLAS